MTEPATRTQTGGPTRPPPVCPDCGSDQLLVGAQWIDCAACGAAWKTTNPPKGLRP